MSFTILFIIIGISCLYEILLLRKDKNKIIACLYIILPFILIHELVLWNTKFDSTLILAIFIFTWIFDTFSYIIGVPLGYHKILPLVSPKKSWEGFLGGFISILIISYIFSINMDHIYQKFESIWWQLTLMLPFTAIAGDFIASYYKRKANVKDSGFLIPGHGGILDRMDSFSVLSNCIFFIRLSSSIAI